MANKTVLFLHGWFSDGSNKRRVLRSFGFDAVNPRLSDWSFRRALVTARQAFEHHRPDLIVGSSRGAVVAMNMDVGLTPLVLLCPPYSCFGRVRRIDQRAVVIHGVRDRWVPVSSSVTLCRNSPNARLIVVDDDHRLNGREGQAALWTAAEMVLGAVA